MTKAVAINFYRTLFKYEGWKNSAQYGEPIDGVKETVDKLLERAFKVFLVKIYNAVMYLFNLV